MRHFLHVVLQTHRYATIDGKTLFEHSHGTAWRPLVDIYEQPGGILIAVDLPGIDKESIQVVVEGDFVKADCFAARPQPLVVPARTLLSQLL